MTARATSASAPVPASSVPRGFEVLLIDGRSGSGKSTLADQVVADFEATGARAQLLRLEDLYPGWDGLAEGSLAVARALAGGGYRRYDWHTSAFAEWRTLTPHPPLIIEGCGALTRENLRAAERWADDGARVRSAWLECPAEVRRERAFTRDGGIYAPHWERWAVQEDAHYAQHRPWLLADQVLGAACKADPPDR